MYFHTMHDLLTMDGHGIYVWPVFFVSTLVIVPLLLAPIRRRKRTLAQLAGELKRNPHPRIDRLAGEP